MEDVKSIVIDGKLYQLTEMEGEYSVIPTVTQKRKTSSIAIPAKYRKAVTYLAELLGFATDRDFIDEALKRRINNEEPLVTLPTVDEDEPTTQYTFWISTATYDKIKRIVGKKRGSYGEFVVSALFGWQ